MALTSEGLLLKEDHNEIFKNMHKPIIIENFEASESHFHSDKLHLRDDQISRTTFMYIICRGTQCGSFDERS